ncbi:hypothetical protein LZ24_02517 [Desulfobotulus alkaliphilus]|uniref:Uncharacterized protein n=1 Tax=Desulfobotulus alkaliphilus TaxID=622671 RepID=A0A562RJ23_9BACT|nr:hypothetical protein LZ24_02517 [Desulfobotulus alkaliphilus]
MFFFVIQHIYLLDMGWYDSGMQFLARQMREQEMVSPLFYIEQEKNHEHEKRI